MRGQGLRCIFGLSRQTLDAEWGFSCRSMATTYKPTENDTVSIVRKRGMDVLHDPIHNSEALTHSTCNIIFSGHCPRTKN